MVLQTLATAQSIQDIPPADLTGGGNLFRSFMITRGPLLPPYGTRECEEWLRRYDRYDHNLVWRSARAGLVRKWCGAPWSLRAETKIYAPLSPYWGRYGYGRDVDEVAVYQDVLQKSQLGKGWDTFFGRVGRAFLTQNNGAWIEIIGPGDPSGPLIGAVTGTTALDPIRCYPTGNPEFPVVYYSTRT